LRRIFNTDNYPSTKGRPYSQAIIANGFLFVSGSSPRNPKTGIKPTTLREQTLQALTNIKALLEDAGTSIDNVVKATVYLKDLKDYEAMNEVYAKYLGDKPPARTTVFVNSLPKGVLIEIDAIAKL